MNIRRRLFALSALISLILIPGLISLIFLFSENLKSKWLFLVLLALAILFLIHIFIQFHLDDNHSHSNSAPELDPYTNLQTWRKNLISSLQSNDIEKRLNLLLDDQNRRLPLTCIEQLEKVNPVQKSNNSLITTTRLLEIFNRKDVYGRLLILGQPGAGKTITLLTLAQELAEIAERDPESPIPVFIELTDGKLEKELDAWLNSRMNAYRIPAEFLDSGQVIPFLDGLDELGSERLDEAIQSINKYLSEKKTRRMVICCRLEEYDQSNEKLDQLNAAVCLQPLHDSQIRAYLNRNHPGLWETIQQKANLRELLEFDGDNPGILRRPFFLRIVPLALEKNSDIQNQQELIEAYIDRQLDPELIKAERRLRLQGRSKFTPKAEEKLTNEQIIKYLNFLADQLNRSYEIEFSPQNIPPAWLNKNGKLYYNLSCWLLSIFILGFTFISGGLVLGLGIKSPLSVSASILVITLFILIFLQNKHEMQDYLDGKKYYFFRLRYLLSLGSFKQMPYHFWSAMRPLAGIISGLSVYSSWLVMRPEDPLFLIFFLR